ncbi:hypothetical protein HN51_004093 [Arachis hypogaea]
MANSWRLESVASIKDQLTMEVCDRHSVHIESRFLVCKDCCTLCRGTSRFKVEAENRVANRGAGKEASR